MRLFSLSMYSIFTCAILLSFSSSAAIAQTPATPAVLDVDEALAVDAKIYADSYGVALEEAMKRLTIMSDVEGDISMINREEGDDYAGTFFDNRSATFGIVVRTKKAARANRELTRRAGPAMRDPRVRADRRTQRRALRATFKITDTEVELAETVRSREVRVPVRFGLAAKNSLRETQAILSSNWSALSQISGFQTAYVDQQSGEVVVMFDAVSAAAATAALGSILPILFRVELVAGGFVDASTRGGQIITASGARHCMTGFAAKRTVDGVLGLVTAGHCSRPLLTLAVADRDISATYPLTQGPATNGATTFDLMFVTGSSPVGEFYFDNTGSVRNVTGIRSRLSTTTAGGVATSASPATTLGTTSGAFVCHLGQEAAGSTSYIQSCGEVISINASKPGGPPSATGGEYVLVRNTQSGAGTLRSSGAGTLRCIGGDSGGPFFAGTVAYGILSACASSTADPSAALYALYTSVDSFSKIGVQILVK
jgi:hypothetical protein